LRERDATLQHLERKKIPPIKRGVGDQNNDQANWAEHFGETLLKKEKGRQLMGSSSLRNIYEGGRGL